MIKEMNLQSIVNKFKNSRNIQEKRKLKPILDNISSNGYNSSQIYASYGEDSMEKIQLPFN